MPGPSIAEIFNSTSPDFDLVTPLVWGPAGETLVARARVALGDEVLDICSGTGASALAAARVVGPDGHVTAVDFAADLVERGRTSAYAAGLRNIDFRVDDVTATRRLVGMLARKGYGSGMAFAVVRDELSRAGRDDPTDDGDLG